MACRVNSATAAAGAPMLVTPSGVPKEQLESEAPGGFLDDFARDFTRILGS
jgi:hypothetical protein